MTTTPLEHDPDIRPESWDLRSMPPGMLLAKLGREAMRQFAEAVKPTELTTGHVAALYYLGRCAVSQQVLSDVVGVDPSKLVGLLNDLEEEGLIVRRRHPADRRRHIVEISEQGRKRLAEVETAVAEVEERLLAGLDGEQRHELHRLLGHIVGNTPLDSCASLVDPTLDVWRKPS
jgi:DNA-binding MarR family transcriptional regulator